MRVKKLDIFGFKSFALKQAITFGDGVTGIVGPNGCGKSNVVDAMRWVMGEQNARHLRGGNMQDIIFCGSEKKAPLGFAEVTLTIDNTAQDAPLEYNHFQEIEITRRLYKTGESEYEINRQKARLKDISDFFLGTGVGTKAYSIIEQGRVNEIVSAKPIDRRLIIEEAAGITKYKAKKNIAERRIENTRTNLNRIVDIKNEVDRRVAALLKEKEKLEKVLALKNRLRDIDLHCATHQFLGHHAKLSFLNKEQENTHAAIAANKREFLVLEHSFTKVLDEYSKAHDARRLLENLETEHRTSLELVKKDLEYARATLSDNINYIARTQAQLEELEDRKEELIKEIENFREEKRASLEQENMLNRDITNHKNAGDDVLARRQKHLTDEREQERLIVQAASRAARLQSQITVLEEQGIKEKLDAKNLRQELLHKASELQHCETQKTTLENELQTGNLLKEELANKIARKNEEYRDITESLTKAKKDLRIIDEERVGLVSRMKSLKEIADSCEWSESGIGDVLASVHKNLVKGILGEVIRVKPGFEDAVERYLAHIFDAAIIYSHEDLLLIARFIKEKQLPKTAFFLLNGKMKPKLAKPLGLKCLTDFVSVDEAFSPLTEQLEKFFLAENLSSALHHWPAAQIAEATIISEQGELLLPDGRVIVLGHDNNKGVLKRKNEMSELEQKIALMDERKERYEEQAKKIEDEEKSVVKTRAVFMEEHKNLLLGLVRLEESVKQRTLEHARIGSDQQKLLSKEEELFLKHDLFDGKLAELSKEWSEALLEHKNHEEALEALHAVKVSVEILYDAYQQKMRDLEIQKIGASQKVLRYSHSITDAQKSLTHVEVSSKTFSHEIDEKALEELRLKETIRQNEKKQSQLTEEIDAACKMLHEKRKLCGELSHIKEVEEAKLHALTTHEQALQKTLHEVELLQNNVSNELNNTEERIKEKYRLNLSDYICDFHHVPLDEHKANILKNELTKTKERLGTVNENAAVEYDEFSKRSDFLRAQVDDLNDGLAQLEDAMKKINKTTKMRFMEAFHNINQQFSKVFPRLFNGGKAELMLLNEEDLLNCGVDILAKPPGKNIGSIELMSGGEKALTAISLIMAIFLIKPSPFCLLDEVDAPLDEANVARFSQLIKEMSQLSQFIVITHNRKTMESADKLYGVTMEDAGLSKIVSVHVQQAFEALKTEMPKATRASQLFLDETVS